METRVHVIAAGCLALLLPLPACKATEENDRTVAQVEYAAEFRIVRIDASASTATQLAVHACAGLFNRRLGGSVFVQTDEDVPQSRIDGALLRDERWLETLNLTPAATVGFQEFLNECVAEFDDCVRYSYATQQEILPAILTAAAAQGAVPLDVEAPVACPAPVLDAVKVFADKPTQLLSTQYVYENFLAQTSGLAMLNPGYNREPKDLANPDMLEDMPVALIDFVFSRKLFVTFLINGCTKDHPERELLGKIVGESGWQTPIGVYGYNDSWLAGGYLWEAQTRCLEAGNMGAIPTRTTNLSFFDTRRPPIEQVGELPLSKLDEVSYDPQKTYVAFVIGDGDNIRYIMSTRQQWLTERLVTCRDAAPKCPPLTWTISPHLPDIAPDVLEWYYQAAHSTGADYFALPPSGYLYAYPSLMGEDDQARFAAGSEATARILGTRSVVHWEWFESWRAAREVFLPRYARKGGQIQGVFPVNVPYMIEAFPGWPADQMVDVLDGSDGGRIALFRSQSWRGVNGADEFHVTPQAMADRLGAFPHGTVTWVYMTSDGGLTLANSYQELTKILPGHVQLVSTDTAARLAIEADRR